MKYVKCHKVEEKPSYPLYSDKEYEEALAGAIEWADANVWDTPLYLVDVLLNAQYRYNNKKE